MSETKTLFLELFYALERVKKKKKKKKCNKREKNCLRWTRKVKFNEDERFYEFLDSNKQVISRDGPRVILLLFENRWYAVLLK